MSKPPYRAIPGLRLALGSDLKSLKVTQRQIADHFGLTQQAINQWFSKEHIPPHQIQGLVALLGTESETAKLLQNWLKSRRHPALSIGLD